jgi:hypothetical protein
MAPIRPKLLALALLAVCLALPGCKKANKNLTKDNLDKIKVGMTPGEVEAILGRGEDDPEGLGLSEGSSVAGAAGIGGDLSSVSRPRSTIKWVKWGDDKKYIRIGFDNSKVADGKIDSKGL